MAEQADQQVPDVMQFWRDWLTQSERQFNAFFAQSMNTEPFARSVGGYMEMYATFQRMMAQGMERYLALINIPSRTDVIGLGEAMRAMDERLARIEELLQIAVDAGGSRERDAAPPSEPSRTRRPPGVPAAGEVSGVPAASQAPGVPAADKADADDQTIPIELRR